VRSTSPFACTSLLLLLLELPADLPFLAVLFSPFPHFCSAVPHPVLNPRDSPVTLFVKDPQRHYKDLLPSLKINFISRVVGLDKLRNKHKTFEAKRALLKESDLFLVDDRVLIETGKCIGKMWRDAKKCVFPAFPPLISLLSY
jgi:hypothetical protein